MSSPILDALPGIHATVISFGGAFFSAFAVYAYQKLREAADNVNRTLKDLETVSSATSHQGANVDLFLENGELDWDGRVRAIFEDLRTLCQAFESSSEKTGVEIPAISEDELVSKCHTLCYVLGETFTSYPFSGRPIAVNAMFAERIEQRKTAPFDAERVEKMRQRLLFLRWIWEAYRAPILEFAKHGSAASKRKRQENTRREYERNVAVVPALQERVKLEDLEKRDNAYDIDYSEVIAGYFQQAAHIERELYPSLFEGVRISNVYNDQFQVRMLSYWMLGITVFVLIFGVFLPPLIQSLRIDFLILTHPVIDYSLIAITPLPYFFACFWVWRKLKNFTLR